MTEVGVDEATPPRPDRAAPTRSPATTATIARNPLAKLFDGLAAFGGGCRQELSHFVVADLVEVGEHLTDSFETPAASLRTPRRRPPRRAGGRLMPAPPAPRRRSAPDWPPGPPAPRRACWHRSRFRHRRESPSCLPHPRAGGRRDRPARDGCNSSVSRSIAACNCSSADSEAAHHAVIDDHATAGGQRAHRQLLPLRHTELADQETRPAAPAGRPRPPTRPVRRRGRGPRTTRLSLPR